MNLGGPTGTDPRIERIHMVPAQHVRHGPALGLVIAICAAVNLTKPVHIDDAGHVEIARLLVVNPFKVMTLEFNWGDTLMPLATWGRPPLILYMFALVMAIAGESLLALHAFIGILTAAAVAVFYLLARRLAPGSALFLTALLFLGPVFLPGQDLMTDVPLLLTWLVTFWGLISATPERHHARYRAASIAIALACLIKYPSLALLPTFFLVIVLRRQWSCLVYLLIPAAALAGWSLFNYLEYGRIHLLESRYPSIIALRLIVWTIDWIAGLGSVALFSVMFLSGTSRRRLGKVPFVAGSVGGLVAYPTCILAGSSQLIAVVWAAFFANGLFMLGVLLKVLREEIGQDWRERDTGRLEVKAILLLWLGGTCLFVILYAPQMAIRHVLLSTPPLLLLLGSFQERFVGRRWQNVGLALTAALGIALAVSDYCYADVYRRSAYEIVRDLPVGSRIWFTGQWGWHYYAQEAGMQAYDTQWTTLTKGDYLVIPSLVQKEDIPPKHKPLLKKVSEITVGATPLTWLRTMSIEPWGGYYAFSFHRQGPPWRPSCDPLEVFDIYIVTEPAPSSSQRSE
jgi:4-amino-4-deoxy-L-arabinose transferase-like glycosyltransferase